MLWFASEVFVSFDSSVILSYRKVKLNTYAELLLDNIFTDETDSPITVVSINTASLTHIFDIFDWSGRHFRRLRFCG